MTVQTRVSPPRAPRKRGPKKSDLRLNQIIESAASCFARNGYDETSLQDIANVVGIRKSSLYAHVTSKQELLLKILDAYITDMLAGANAIADSPLSARDKLSRLFHLLYEAIEKYRDHVTVFFEEMRYLEHPDFVAIRRKRDEFEKLTIGIIEEGVSKGEFVPLNPRIVSFFVVGLATWSYRWFNPRGRLNVREITDLTMQVLIDGLGTPER